MSYLGTFILLSLLPALALAQPANLKRATASIDAALTQARRSTADCQTVVSGNLQAARTMVDDLKLNWTQDGAKRAKDWLANTAVAGGLTSCPPPLLDLIRRASSQVADAAPAPDSDLAAPVLPRAAGACSSIADLARDWDALGDYLDEHEGGGLDVMEATHVAQVERQLIRRSIDLVRATMASNKRFQRLGAKLLGQLLQLDAVDDDANWSADVALMLRIVKTVSKISRECGSYF